VIFKKTFWEKKFPHFKGWHLGDIALGDIDQPHCHKYTKNKKKIL